MANFSRISIPPDIRPYPSDYEISAALIMSDYFDKVVHLVKRSETAKSADFLISGKYWELKSPVGNSKHTIQNNLRKADNQSCNIVLDLRRCKMHSSQAISRIKHELSLATNIKRLIVIQKNTKVLVLKGKI